jgi:hypothetical protein
VIRGSVLIVNQRSGNSCIVIYTQILSGTVRWAAFAAGFGPALNAMANQYSMPDVIQPMRDKSWARAVGNVAFTFCTVVYVALGLMGSLAFDNVNRLISINWTTYTGKSCMRWRCTRNYCPLPFCNQGNWPFMILRVCAPQ